MTEEELDLLASAHVDGETTSDEVAVLRDVVQADPDLAGRFAAKVEALQAISGQVGDVPVAPAGVKDLQIAAALGLFEEIKPTEGQVLDLEARAKALKTADSMNRARRVRVGRMPQWLPSAAVFLLIGGGLIFVVANGGGDDDSATDSAVEAFDASSTEAGSSDEAASDGEQEAGEDSADEDTAGGETALEERSAQANAPAEEADLVAEDAMEDDAAEAEESEESADDEAAGSTDSGDAEPLQGGFFPEEPVMIYADIPDLEELAANLEELPDLFDPELSVCGPELTVEETAVLVGYLPVEVAGDPAELFILETAGTPQAVLLDAISCLPIG